MGTQYKIIPSRDKVKSDIIYRVVVSLNPLVG